MKKRFTVLFIAAVFICCTLFCFPASAASSTVLDYAGVISDGNEQLIAEEAARVAEKTGFNIAVVASDDIGTPKTDAHVVDYADDLYEELYGIDTDGILFLINCDTKYDYISTSGVCINYFSDSRIDAIFDAIWDDLVDGNYDQAAYSFVFYVEQFYDKGKANNQQEILGHEVDLPVDASNIIFSVIMSFFLTFTPLLIFGAVIGAVLYAGFSRNFKLEKPVTRNYVLDNSVAYDRSEDTYLGTNVNRIYTPRSSSSGGSHGGSHHSSTHHSHSGGRHGGGGRHR